MIIRFFGREFIVPAWLKYLIISLVAVILIVVGVIITKNSKNGEITPVVSPQNTKIVVTASPRPSDSPPKDTVFVYIVGEINVPGVYEIESGSILSDLVTLAGGLTDKADSEAVNLAFCLSGGMMIKIPSLEDSDKTWLVDSGTASQNSAGSVAQGQKVNINKATVAELCTLPGIGESTALKIINYRTENGPFKDISDITKVSGIKSSRYNDIKNYITV